MIGLGSNRLTVCRRGGMSVTQAGRGGMEWLGYHVPLWSSPYSAQATAALKAQFPTQWATIRDYGFAHPEIVGYMNAYAPEDAKIAYSLVEGIGTRWLKGDGVAYIYTDIQATDDMTWKLVGKIGAYQGEFTTLLGFHDTSDFGYPLLCWRDETNKLQAHRHHRVIRDNSQDWKSQIHTYEIRSDGLYIDGQRRETWYSDITYQIGKVALFRNSMRTTISKSEFVSFETTTDRDHKLVPFKRAGGNCGVMDLETGNFYGNSASSGTLTISETPAS